MTNPNFDDDDKPLDAAQLRLQARLKKLLLGSTLVMVVGFVAVFAAIFYRVTRTDGKPAPTFEHPLVADLPLPDGARVTATRIDGDRLTVTMEGPKGATVLVLDLATLKAIRRLDLTTGK